MTLDKKNLPVEVVGIGDAMVDLFTHASQLPARGGNIWSTAVRLSPGGTCANVAANISKLGIRSSFVGCVGDDPYGQYTIQEFKKAGVNTQWMVSKSGSFTGIVLAIIDDQGERTFIACAKGAAHTVLLPEDIKTLDFHSISIIQTSGVCLVEEPSRSTLLDGLQQAHQAGCLVYYDPNLRLEGDYFSPELQDAQWQAISFSDVVLIGDEEMELLFPGKTLQEGVDSIFETGAGIVVVKQGEAGATLFSKDQHEQCPAFPVPVVSTAGAGDSFDAGFIAARCRQANLHDALLYANAVASIKVSRNGARSVPGHTETLGFLAEHGEKVESIHRG